MSINRRVSCGTRQVFIFTVWDVEMGLRVTIFLCETEVDDVNLVATLSDTHEKVVGLNITVDK